MPKKKQRAPKGSGSIRFIESKKLWEARVIIGVDPATGRSKRKSIYGKTQGEVRKKLTAILSDLDNGTYSDSRNIKFKDWIKTWMPEFTGNLKGSTLGVYNGYLSNYILPKFGNKPIGAITTIDVQKWLNYLYSLGLSINYIKGIKSYFCKIFNQAIRIGITQSNPVENCTIRHAERKKFVSLGKEDLPAFFDAVKGDRYADFFVFLLFTGMRISEAIGLKWDCVDLDRGSILIDKQLKYDALVEGKYKYVFDTTKTGESRVIFPSDIVLKILRSRKSLENNRVLNDEQYNNYFGLVFTEDNGNNYSKYTVANHFRIIRERLNRPDLRIHDLRHSYATISIQAGDDMKTISENLGHASVSITMDIYAYCTDRMKNDSKNRMDKLLKSL